MKYNQNDASCNNLLKFIEFAKQKEIEFDQDKVPDKTCVGENKVIGGLLKEFLEKQEFQDFKDGKIIGKKNIYQEEDEKDLPSLKYIAKYPIKKILQNQKLQIKLKQLRDKSPNKVDFIKLQKLLESIGNEDYSPNTYKAKFYSVYKKHNNSEKQEKQLNQENQDTQDTQSLNSNKKKSKSQILQQFSQKIKYSVQSLNNSQQMVKKKPVQKLNDNNNKISDFTNNNKQEKINVIPFSEKALNQQNGQNQKQPQISQGQIIQKNINQNQSSKKKNLIELNSNKENQPQFKNGPFIYITSQSDKIDQKQLEKFIKDCIQEQQEAEKLKPKYEIFPQKKQDINDKSIQIYKKQQEILKFQEKYNLYNKNNNGNNQQQQKNDDYFKQQENNKKIDIQQESLLEQCIKQATQQNHMSGPPSVFNS
ncbi:hypothetical protein PPERSA_00966 [Pseudocohnilembus persalinus]|uniref:Uncharacterized protein n=1 Tax=Pseudocohnilembus persalinus TaxID=266149 RepID=A0A0V0R8H3_PSEPJ|nr:hypothetical protein PPERSA_00966 [Pseudocohnilembus persalinus]|eukprot:KRX10796.1 hypothetical protein PPERSA_00966 [Pseudocohnilembus persalinus]